MNIESKCAKLKEYILTDFLSEYPESDVIVHINNLVHFEIFFMGEKLQFSVNKKDFLVDGFGFPVHFAKYEKNVDSWFDPLVSVRDNVFRVARLRKNSDEDVKTKGKAYLSSLGVKMDELSPEQWNDFKTFVDDMLSQNPLLDDVKYHAAVMSGYEIVKSSL